MQRYTGLINAICPTCKQSVRSESVPGSELSYVRGILKKLVKFYKREFPFARIVTTDPLKLTER